jgi:hypothetical protein
MSPAPYSVCCTMSAALCLLRCPQHLVRCLLSVSRFLLHFFRCTLSAACFSLHIDCCTLSVARCLLWWCVRVCEVCVAYMCPGASVCVHSLRASACARECCRLELPSGSANRFAMLRLQHWRARAVCVCTGGLEGLAQLAMAQGSSKLFAGHGRAGGEPRPTVHAHLAPRLRAWYIHPCIYPRTVRGDRRASHARARNSQRMRVSFRPLSRQSGVFLQAEQLRLAKDEVRPLAVHVGLHGGASACTTTHRFWAECSCAHACIRPFPLKSKSVFTPCAHLAQPCSTILVPPGFEGTFLTLAAAMESESIQFARPS